jgi:hypothetical protein
VSESDSFIHEVTEEVRRDQMVRFFNRHRWTMVGILVVIVAAVGYNEYAKSAAQAQAEATGDAMIAAIDATTPEAQVEALTPLAGTGTDSDAVARMQLAAAQLRAEDNEAATATLTALAEDQKVEPLFRSIARLKLVMAQGSDMPADERMAAIDAVIAEGGPLRPLAAEQKALALIDAGDREAALNEFTTLAQDIEASEPLRQRAQQMVVVLGGSVPDIVDEALGQ